MSAVDPLWLRRPGWLLALLLLATVAVVPLAARLRLSGDIAGLMPRSSAAAQTFRSYQLHLSAGQDLIVVLRGEDPSALPPLAERYAAALTELPEVGQVSYRISGDAALALRDNLLWLLTLPEQEELARRLAPERLRAQAQRLRGLLTLPGGGAMAPLLTADPLELLPLLSRRLSAGLPVDTQSGYFRSADGKALLIKVKPRFSPRDYDRCEALLQQAGAAARRLGLEVAGLSIPEVVPRPLVAFTGSYAFPPYYRHLMERDLSRSTVVSAGAVLLLFALWFRSLRILPVVLLPLGCAGVWTAALAVPLWGELSAVALSFGTILIAIGIDLPIQLYNRMREELPQAADARAVVRRCVGQLAGPALVATAGPALVFLCGALSDYRGLQQLGVLAALGLLLNCLAMLTVFPLLLLLLPQRLWLSRSPPPARRGLIAGWLGAVESLGPRGRRGLLLGCALLGLVALPLLGRLRLADELLVLEPEGLPPAVAQRELNRRFGDRQRFLVALITDADRGAALDRADRWLPALEALKARGLLQGYEALGSLVPGPAALRERRAGLDRLDLPRAAQALEEALLAEGFAPDAFAPFLKQLRALPPPPSLGVLERGSLGFLVRSHLADLPAAAGGGRPGAMVSLFLFAPADGRLPELLRALEQVAAEVGGGLTGLPLLEQQLGQILRRDTGRVMAVAVLLVALLLAGYYRRPRALLAALLPLLLAWIWFGAALWLLRLPLNLFNLLALPLCIGYGIDDHVFLIHRYQEERGALPRLYGPARAIVLTSLATVAGFGGLLFSGLSGLRLFGQCGVLAVLACLVAALLVLPLLLKELRAAPPAPADPPPA